MARLRNVPDSIQTQKHQNAAYTFVENLFFFRAVEYNYFYVNDSDSVHRNKRRDF